ncbi:hypothetical protein Dimus_016324 [Dionaea muscipula]
MNQTKILLRALPRKLKTTQRKFQEQDHSTRINVQQDGYDTIMTNTNKLFLISFGNNTFCEFNFWIPQSRFPPFPCIISVCICTTFSNPTNQSRDRTGPDRTVTMTILTVIQRDMLYMENTILLIFCLSFKIADPIHNCFQEYPPEIYSLCRHFGQGSASLCACVFGATQLVRWECAFSS